MRKRIDTFSHLEIEGNTVSITISSFSFKNFFWFIVILIIKVYSIFWYSIGKEPNLFIIIIPLIFFLLLLYSLFHYQTIKWDLDEYKVWNYSFFMGVRFSSEEIAYQPQSEFLYENEYDSYKQISHVWLVARAGGGIIKEKLFYFENVDSFLEFKRIFNDWKPEYKIMEWHE
jgi:hypothetical protein